MYLLQLALDGKDLTSFKEPKISTLILGLKRKGYLEESGIISGKGKALYESLLIEDSSLQLNVIENRTDSFEAWWKAFPSTDSFTFQEKKFTGSRSFKNDKDGCKIKFMKILSQGYTVEELIAALQLEVQEKKAKSITDKKNCLSYLKNTHAYLTQFAFEGYLERIREGEEIKTETPKQTQRFL